MTAIIEVAHRVEIDFREAVSDFIKEHPLIASIAITIGFPISILLSVSAGAAGIMLPIAYLMGWM